ncbi:unnamed protein product [Sympodiomycopsis kandeliae]
MNPPRNGAKQVSQGNGSTSSHVSLPLPPLPPPSSSHFPPAPPAPLPPKPSLAQHGPMSRKGQQQQRNGKTPLPNKPTSGKGEASSWKHIYPRDSTVPIISDAERSQESLNHLKQQLEKLGSPRPSISETQSQPVPRVRPPSWPTSVAKSATATSQPSATSLPVQRPLTSVDPRPRPPNVVPTSSAIILTSQSLPNIRPPTSTSPAADPLTTIKASTTQATNQQSVAQFTSASEQAIASAREQNRSASSSGRASTTSQSDTSVPEAQRVDPVSASAFSPQSTTKPQGTDLKGNAPPSTEKYSRASSQPYSAQGLATSSSKSLEPSESERLTRSESLPAPALAAPPRRSPVHQYAPKQSSHLRSAFAPASSRPSSPPLSESQVLEQVRMSPETPSDFSNFVNDLLKARANVETIRRSAGPDSRTSPTASKSGSLISPLASSSASNTTKKRSSPKSEAAVPPPVQEDRSIIQFGLPGSQHMGVDLSESDSAVASIPAQSTEDLATTSEQSPSVPRRTEIAVQDTSSYETAVVPRTSSQSVSSSSVATPPDQSISSGAQSYPRRPSLERTAELSTMSPQGADEGAKNTDGASRSEPQPNNAVPYVPSGSDIHPQVREIAVAAQSPRDAVESLSGMVDTARLHASSSPASRLDQVPNQTSSVNPHEIDRQHVAIAMGLRPRDNPTTSIGQPIVQQQDDEDARAVQPEGNLLAKVKAAWGSFSLDSIDDVHSHARGEALDSLQSASVKDDQAAQKISEAVPESSATQTPSTTTSELLAPTPVASSSLPNPHASLERLMSERVQGERSWTFLSSASAEADAPGRGGGSDDSLVKEDDKDLAASSETQSGLAAPVDRGIGEDQQSSKEPTNIIGSSFQTESELGSASTQKAVAFEVDANASSNDQAPSQPQTGDETDEIDELGDESQKSNGSALSQTSKSSGVPQNQKDPRGTELDGVAPAESSLPAAIPQPETLPFSLEEDTQMQDVNSSNGGGVRAESNSQPLDTQGAVRGTQAALESQIQSMQGDENREVLQETSQKQPTPFAESVLESRRSRSAESQSPHRVRSASTEAANMNRSMPRSTALAIDSQPAQQTLAQESLSSLDQLESSIALDAPAKDEESDSVRDQTMADLEKASHNSPSNVPASPLRSATEQAIIAQTRRRVPNNVVEVELTQRGHRGKSSHGSDEEAIVFQRHTPRRSASRGRSRIIVSSEEEEEEDDDDFQIRRNERALQTVSHKGVAANTGEPIQKAKLLLLDNALPTDAALKEVMRLREEMQASREEQAWLANQSGQSTQGAGQLVAPEDLTQSTDLVSQEAWAEPRMGRINSPKEGNLRSPDKRQAAARPLRLLMNDMLARQKEAATITLSQRSSSMARTPTPAPVLATTPSRSHQVHTATASAEPARPASISPRAAGKAQNPQRAGAEAMFRFDTKGRALPKEIIAKQIAAGYTKDLAIKPLTREQALEKMAYYRSLIK